jgi:hypothetical protein
MLPAAPQVTFSSDEMTITFGAVAQLLSSRRPLMQTIFQQFIYFCLVVIRDRRSNLLPLSPRLGGIPALEKSNHKPQETAQRGDDCFQPAHIKTPQ